MLKLDVMNHLETLKRTRTIGIYTVRMVKSLLASYTILAIDTIVKISQLNNFPNSGAIVRNNILI